MTKLQFFQCYFTGSPPEPFRNWHEYTNSCCSGDIPCLHGIEIKARKWREEAMRPTTQED